MFIALSPNKFQQIKISAEVLSQPLADAINNSLSKGDFHDNAIIAPVSPIDKQSDDKDKVPNFRPVSVLNTFSKIYESFTKNQLISVLNKRCLPGSKNPQRIVPKCIH